MLQSLGQEARLILTIDGFERIGLNTFRSANSAPRLSVRSAELLEIIVAPVFDIRLGHFGRPNRYQNIRSRVLPDLPCSLKTIFVRKMSFVDIDRPLMLSPKVGSSAI